MKRLINTKFYKFDQNNPNGKFDVNEDVCGSVVVEAIDKKLAICILESMLCNETLEDKENRWDNGYSGEIETEEIDINKYKQEGYEVCSYFFNDDYDAEIEWYKMCNNYKILEHPTIKSNKYHKRYLSGKIYFEDIKQYCQYIADNYGMTTPAVRIHFIDGTKKQFIKN